MEKHRFIILGIGTVVAGAVCYVLAGQDRMTDIAVIVWMVLMTFWFTHKDHELDSYEP